MTPQEHLGIWDVDSRGRGIPLSHSGLCHEVEKLSPEEIGFKVVERLQAEGFIATLPDGRRTLTAKGMAVRIPLQTRPAVKDESNEKYWSRFRSLCAYYTDCVTQSEKQQEYLFANDRNNKWFLPVLPLDWLTAASFSVATQKTAVPAVNRIKCRQVDEEDVYIGYPLEAFACSNGQTGYSPIMLFPVEVALDAQNITLSIRRDEIDINRTWLEFNVPHEEQKNVMASVCFAESEKTGLLDPSLVVQYLSNRFVRTLAEPLNPGYLDYNVDGTPRGMLNQAALFVGNPLKYSKTLKKELRDIANQPASVLDKTALAYIFRDPPLPNSYERDPRILPLDFLDVPSNKEQHVALSQALNAPMSRVTGPPGTGKSQVAVNLIANLVFNSQSALFASKNHKAIHAIDERAKSVSPDLQLVQFCTLPSDGSVGAVWHRQSLENIVGHCERLSRENLFTHAQMRRFDDTIMDWRDWWAEMAEIDSTRSVRQDIAARRETCEKQVPDEVLNKGDVFLSEAFRLRIERLASRIGEPEIRHTFLQRFLDFLLRRKHREQKAETELRILLPRLAANAKSVATLRERTLRLCGDIADYLAVQAEEYAVRDKPTELPHDGTIKLSDGIAFRRDNLKNSYLFRRTRDVLSVPENVREGVQNAARRIQRQTLPFLANVLPPDNADAARDAFHQFAKFYPAWATTLLSLSKASPCIAGLFDRAIIDEASQCEIPPVIPALYRARGVTVIGDPAQFPPVITIREPRHAYMRFQKHKLVEMPERFNFTTGNAFTLVTIPPLMLREHFRCHEDIAGYFNDEYYNGKLRVRTNSERLKFPANMGFKQATVWRNVTDSLETEIATVKQLLTDLRHNEYTGTIGVISPFRKIADRLKQELHGNSMLDVSSDINTANGFQGGERDLIIFVLGLTSATTRGEDWYAVAPENNYIYNVAVSRARACLIVVGDKECAAKSESAPLRRLAAIEQRSARTLSQSPGEEKLCRALRETGLNPVQQYPLAGRYLDLALVDAKIDVEVDGAAYHLNHYGERKADDIYRDLQILSNGWRVIRFWHNEVTDDVGGCVARVIAMI
ncbi:MAG: AAA domain-containing protein [Kiritimatiellia bacterium]